LEIGNRKVTKREAGKKQKGKGNRKDE